MRDESPSRRVSGRYCVKFSRYLRCFLLLAFSWAGRAEERPVSREESLTPTGKFIVAKEGQETRVMSTRFTQAIRAQLPEFKPAPPTPAPFVAAAETGDVPIILELVVVTEKKVPKMEEFQMLTKAGQTAYLQKLFPGAVVPLSDPLDESTPNYAVQMLRDNRRKESQRTWGETVATLRATGDEAGSNRLKEEVQRALTRSYDWRDERIDKSYNNGRR